jgi:hypothetical protein
VENSPVFRVVTQRMRWSREKITPVNSEQEALALANRLQRKGTYCGVHAQEANVNFYGGWRTFSTCAGDNGGIITCIIVLSIGVLVAIGWVTVIVISWWQGRYELLTIQVPGLVLMTIILRLWFGPR